VAPLWLTFLCETHPRGFQPNATHALHALRKSMRKHLALRAVRALRLANVSYIYIFISPNHGSSGMK